MIVIKDLSLLYQQEAIFQQFSVTLSTERWTSIIGRSGLGKSTLLHLLAGLLPLSCQQKQLQVHGQIETKDSSPLSQQVVLLTQQNQLLPWCVTWKNVALGALLRGENHHHAYERAQQFLCEVGLPKVALLKAHQLSGGMQQRVALARVLFEDKPIVLLDEPFSALDMVTKAELYPLLKTALSKRTVIHVTHDVREAFLLADEVIVLRGKPVEVSQRLIRDDWSCDGLDSQEKWIQAILRGITCRS